MLARLLIRDCLLGLIVFYQRFLSILFGPCCRFHPTCSEYARQALLSHGVCRGLSLSLRRLCRCHPFHRGPMFDPVPPAGKLESSHREI